MPVNMDTFPMKLLRQSRELAWDPLELDYSRERGDWDALNEAERNLLVKMTLGFLLGERGVTHDLAPLQMALRPERGRMEEEMYLTMQLMEEARHVEFFQLWMNQALPGVIGTDIPFPNARGNVFNEVLPKVMGALTKDRSPRAQLRATTLYHQIVEGVLAELGYQVFYQAFEKRGIMPALTRGVHLIQRDEVRHIAFGTYLAQRILIENPELEKEFDGFMDEFRVHGETFVDSIFIDHPDGRAPFGLEEKPMRELVMQFFESRIHQVKRGQLVALGI